MNETEAREARVALDDAIYRMSVELRKTHYWAKERREHLKQNIAALTRLRVSISPAEEPGS